MNNLMDYYRTKSIDELSTKYVLFENDTETGHTEAIMLMYECMASRIGMENTNIRIAQARDVYRMLVPPPAQGTS